MVRAPPLRTSHNTSPTASQDGSAHLKRCHSGWNLEFHPERCHSGWNLKFHPERSLSGWNLKFHPERCLSGWNLKFHPERSLSGWSWALAWGGAAQGEIGGFRLGWAASWDEKLAAPSRGLPLRMEMRTFADLDFHFSIFFGAMVAPYFSVFLLCRHVHPDTC